MSTPNTPGGGDPYRGTTPDRPDARTVRDLHTNSDVDASGLAQHHTLGVEKNTAAEGSHTHDGRTSRKINLSDITKNPPSVTGSRGGNAALQSLLNQLATQGLIINNTVV